MPFLPLNVYNGRATSRPAGWYSGLHEVANRSVETASNLLPKKGHVSSLVRPGPWDRPLIYALAALRNHCHVETLAPDHTRRSRVPFRLRSAERLGPSSGLGTAETIRP